MPRRNQRIPGTGQTYGDLTGSQRGNLVDEVLTPEFHARYDRVKRLGALMTKMGEEPFKAELRRRGYTKPGWGDFERAAAEWDWDESVGGKTDGE